MLYMTLKEEEEGREEFGVLEGIIITIDDLFTQISAGIGLNLKLLHF
jgi:hypothetical protein